MFLTLNLHFISVQVRNWQYSLALLHSLARRNGMCTIPSKSAQNIFSRFSTKLTIVKVGYTKQPFSW